MRLDEGNKKDPSDDRLTIHFGYNVPATITYKRSVVSSAHSANRGSDFEIADTLRNEPPEEDMDSVKEKFEGAWRAVSWSGAAGRGRDPDPYNDEKSVYVSPHTVTFPAGTSFEGWSVNHDVNSASFTSPDGEPMSMRIDEGNEEDHEDDLLTINFGYSEPATITYQRFILPPRTESPEEIDLDSIKEKFEGEWRAVKWWGLNTGRGGDPDPFNDEKLVILTPESVNFPYGSDFGAWSLNPRPEIGPSARCTSPGGESVLMQLEEGNKKDHSDDRLTIHFGYRPAGVIHYERSFVRSSAVAMESNVLSADASTASLAWSDDWVFMGSETYGFVKNGRCEHYGMSRIFEVDDCLDAADTLADTLDISGYSFWDRTAYSLSDRPAGCAYHRFGNVEQFAGMKADCDVNGWGGCFCDEAGGDPERDWTFMGTSVYGFVQNKKCEDYGMLSIHDAVDCKEAAATLGPLVGIDSDYTFIDRTGYQIMGRPVGCSWHSFGNVEQWGETTTADCDEWGFGGCFCLVNF